MTRWLDYLFVIWPFTATGIAKIYYDFVEMNFPNGDSRRGYLSDGTFIGPATYTEAATGTGLFMTRLGCDLAARSKLRLHNIQLL